jgi:hypothetical protein
MKIRTSLITMAMFLLLSSSANAANIIQWKQLPFTPLNPASNLNDVTNVATARFNLSAAVSGINTDITSLTGLTTPLPLAEGGCGSNIAATCRSNIGAAKSGANTDITSLSTLSYLNVSGTTQATSTSDFAYTTVSNNSALTGEGIYETFCGGTCGMYFVDNFRSIVDAEPGSTAQGIIGYSFYSYNNIPFNKTAPVNRNNLVGLFTVTYNLAPGAYSWGVNTACSDRHDVAGDSVASTCLGYEADFGVFNPGSTDNGIGLLISGTVEPASAQAIGIASVNPITTQWTIGLNIGGGGIQNGGFGVLVGAKYPAMPDGITNSVYDSSIISNGTGYGSNLTGIMTWNGGGCSTNPILNVSTDSSGTIVTSSVKNPGVCTTFPVINSTAWIASGGLSAGTGAIFYLTSAYAQLGIGSSSIFNAFEILDQYAQLLPNNEYTIDNNGTSGCAASNGGIFSVSGGTLGGGTPAQVQITVVNDVVAIISNTSSGVYKIPPTNPISVIGTTCTTNPQFEANWQPVGHYVTNYAYASGNGAIYRVIDQFGGGGFDFSLSGGNPAIYAVSPQPTANLILSGKGVGGEVVSTSVFSPGANETGLAIFNSLVFAIHAPSYTYIDNDTAGPLGPYGEVSNTEFDPPTFQSTTVPITITAANTVFISGAPIAGTNVTFTNSWALNVNGSTNINGNAKITTLNVGTAQNNYSFASLVPNFIVMAATYNDPTGSGTDAIFAGTEFDPPNLTSNKPVTITDASTLYISGPPTINASVTAINDWAALINGPTKVGSLTSTGNVIIQGILNLTQATWGNSHPCTPGQISFDTNYIYACVATNTVERAPLSAF